MPFFPDDAYSFTGALLARFFLGFVEGAFFPGAVLLLSMWYTRAELGLRMSILYCGSILSGAFGSLLASAILDGMQGKLGRAAWRFVYYFWRKARLKQILLHRWLFYIEGSLTVTVALLALFILPDFPATTRWLSPLERKLAVKRMAEDAGVVDADREEINVLSAVATDRKPRFDHGFWLAVSDWKVWWFTVAHMSLAVAMSFNNFFPTLAGTLGFNRTMTLMLVAPPYVLTAPVVFFMSRFVHNVCNVHIVLD